MPQSKKMTFAEFQATRRPATAEELAEHFPICGHNGGWIYAEGLAIEDARGWSKFAYYMPLERSEYESDNLEELERKLYDFGGLEEAC